MNTYTLVIFILCCIKVDAQYQLENDPLLDKNFSQQEVAQLDSIRKFFNDHILNTCENEKSLEMCYQQFFDKLLADIKMQTMYSVNIPYKKQKQLYEQIDGELFNSIWRSSNPKAYAPSIDSLVAYATIDLRSQDSPYISFLKDVAKEEPYIGQYLEPIVDFGHLPPSLTQGMINNTSGLNFNNERHQLILAIHFLTVNDQEANRPK